MRSGLALDQHLKSCTHVRIRLVIDFFTTAADAKTTHFRTKIKNKFNQNSV